MNKRNEVNTANVAKETQKAFWAHVKATFFSGVFGSVEIILDKKTGYFNATKLLASVQDDNKNKVGQASSPGKRVGNWLKLKRTQQLLEFYCAKNKTDIFTVRGNAKYGANQRTTGTYVPQELFLDLTSWVSIDFYDKYSQIINEYFTPEEKNVTEFLSKPGPKPIGSAVGQTLRFVVLQVDKGIYKVVKGKKATIDREVGHYKMLQREYPNNYKDVAILMDIPLLHNCLDFRRLFNQRKEARGMGDVLFRWSTIYGDPEAPDAMCALIKDILEELQTINNVE